VIVRVFFTSFPASGVPSPSHSRWNMKYFSFSLVSKTTTMCSFTPMGMPQNSSFSPYFWAIWLHCGIMACRSSNCSLRKSVVISQKVMYFKPLRLIIALNLVIRFPFLGLQLSGFLLFRM